jgi:RNA polymerase sigma-70 factor (ECF subfamily)
MSSPADQPASRLGRDPSVAVRVERLYESHVSLVRSVCRSLLRDRVEAEDAVQQTFLSAQRALTNGSSPRDDAAWLATIARHESLARVRARMREPLPLELEEQDAGPDAHAAAVRRHEAGELRNALADLPPQQREAIVMREMRGLSYEEVAATLSVTTSAVESLLFRARRSLQSRLREALAAASPMWLESLRDLAARVLGGGLAAPAAAKVAAVGVGTAVIAGGAAVGPTVLGLGHAPVPHRPAARPAVHHVSHASASKPPVTFSLDSTSRPARAVAPVRPQHAERSRVRDTGSVDRRETERSSGTEKLSRDSSEQSTTSESTRESSDDGSTRQAASEPSDDSRSTTTGGTSTGPTETTTTPSVPSTDD